MINLKYSVLISWFQFSTSLSMVLSTIRCVAAAIIYILLPFIPHWLCWSSPCLFCWSTLWGIVPGPGALCSWCADGESGWWVLGKTECSTRQPSSSVIMQVPAWLTKGRAVSTHLLERSPDARSVWIYLWLGYVRQTFKTCLDRKLRVCSSISYTVNSNKLAELKGIQLWQIFQVHELISLNKSELICLELHLNVLLNYFVINFTDWSQLNYDCII